MEQDIRWKQRFANFNKALAHLANGIEYNGANPEDLIKDGIIQRFEFTHELAWKVMKDFLKYKGINGLIGSKDATRFAFQNELITEGRIWMDMIESRNKTVHTYDENILNVEFNKIVTKYFPLFIDFQTKMKSLL
jgi:nucleotidyltransferase substrate binding protein (TIGR01987 family)